jgi:polyphosphate kinase
MNEQPITSLYDTRLYINRELSWLEFNQRVLDEAYNQEVPLLERIKFLAIAASNLDEFFMVRVAGLKHALLQAVSPNLNPDGMPPAEQLSRISKRAHDMVEAQYSVFREQLLPALGDHQIRILRPLDLSPEQRRYLADRFAYHIYPVLTPLAIDPGHPLPPLKNKSLNLAIVLERSSAWRETSIFAVVQVPSMLGRLVEVKPAEGRAVMLLEDVIAMHTSLLFPGSRAVGCWPFRITRNSDLTIDEEGSEDLLHTIQKEVRRRDRGNAVRVELAQGASAEITKFLASSLKLEHDDFYLIDGPLNLPDLMKLAPTDTPKELRDEPFLPSYIPAFEQEDTIFEAISTGDIFLHHPYESFDYVVDFITQAAEDPAVLAIKQTLYRTSGDSPVVRALARAAELGKQVTALVELKARFDEENNIAWAHTLAEAGVHVVYGVIGLKTHCKLALVVRREGGALKRYVHLSTGNYNPSTAKLYTDISLFTCRDAFGEDATALFNLLTGYSRPPHWHRFTVAPLGLQEKIISLIDNEAEQAKKTGKGRIIAKMNSLVDAETIRALYAASQAGVQIDLLIRGICCLRPGVPEISENIRVTSVVDRFLEHSRMFYFEAGGREELYLSSADWMPRNFQRRVEILFPVEDPNIKIILRRDILGTMLADNVKAKRLTPEGIYIRVPRNEGDEMIRSQERFLLSAKQKAEPDISPELRIRMALSSKRETSDPRIPVARNPSEQTKQ